MNMMLSKSSPYPRMKYANDSQSNNPPQNVEDFERRWKAFIQSLDVTPQNIQNIDQLEAAQKMELLMNFESKNPKCSAFHYVTLIKGLKSCKVTHSKKKDEFQNAKRILSATEISLRTNNVEWVYDFLKHSGLETLVDYMSQTLLHLIKLEDIQISAVVLASTSGVGGSLSSYPGSGVGNGSEGDYLNTANQSLRRIFDNSNRNNSRMGGSCRYRSTPAINKTTNSIVKLGKSHNMIVESIKECIHLCLKCFRTILNNQKGCRMAFEYKDTINVITLCLLHPSYQTKSLVLDLLSAVCLIEGGHDRVIKAFDIFKVMAGEEKRFETLMYYYRHHETLPLDDYNIDYAVSNMQFINIIVHSVENINLRVYLQYEFSILGLDDFLKKLQERPGDRLNRQVDAYLDNTVDCGVLLEDAEAKEGISAECEKLEKDLASVQEALSQAEAEKSRKIKEAEDRVRKAEKELDKAKTREEELSLLVEQLRSKIRDINVNLSDRESNMQKEISELHEQLKSMTLKMKDSSISSITNNLVSSKNTTKTSNSVISAPNNTAVIHLASDDFLPCNVNSKQTSDSIMGDSNGIGNASPVSKQKQVHPPPLVDSPLNQSHHKHKQQSNTHKIKETAILTTTSDKSSHDDFYDKQATKMNPAGDRLIPNSTVMETSVTSSSFGDMNGSYYQSQGNNATSKQGAPLMKWNVLRNQQGTVFEELDGSKLEEQHTDLMDGFEKIFRVPPNVNPGPNSNLKQKTKQQRSAAQENEYDIPPSSDTIDGALQKAGLPVGGGPKRPSQKQQKQQQKQFKSETTVQITSASSTNSNTTSNTPMISGKQSDETKSNSQPTPAPVRPDEEEKISLLDKNRKNCLKVVVEYLKHEKLLVDNAQSPSSHTNPNAANQQITFREWGRPLAFAISNLEMSSEASDRLLYQLPSFQEIDMYRDISGDSLDVLADEDRLVALLSCLDRVEMKLEAILYMDAFDESFFGLQEKIRTVALACKSVMDSQKLKKILEIVLAFGNRMNDSRRGKAMGFRIQSLDMLPECRSPDDKWSLMNYIVYSIDEKFPDLINFISELESVEDASRVSLCNLMAAVDELATGLERVAEELRVIRDAVQDNPNLIPKRLLNFVNENTNRVIQLKSQAEQARIAFVRTVEWFGEKDLQTASPDLFFGTLTRFMDGFKKAQAENSRRKIGGAGNKQRRHKERKLTDSKDPGRKKNRTRQINADGIMDDILAGLDYQPLQAGIHGRTRTNKRTQHDTSDTHNESSASNNLSYSMGNDACTPTNPSLSIVSGPGTSLMIDNNNYPHQQQHQDRKLMQQQNQQQPKQQQIHVTNNIKK